MLLSFWDYFHAISAAATVGFVSSEIPCTVTLNAADDGYETQARTSIFPGCQVNDYRL